MQRLQRPGHIFWTPAPLSLSNSSSDTSNPPSEEEQEEQEDVCSPVSPSGLEHALGQIGLREDEMGLHCIDSEPGNHLASSPTPAEGEVGEDLNQDYCSIPVMICTHSNVSEEEGYKVEEEYSHTPTKCLNEDLTYENSQVPKEKSSILTCSDTQCDAPSRAPSLPLLISPEEMATCPDIMAEILPETHWSDSSCESSPRPVDTNSEPHNPQTETRTLKGHDAVSKIPVKVPVTQHRQKSAEDSHLSTTNVPKAMPCSSKFSCRPKPSPDRKRRATGKHSTTALFSSGAATVHRPDLSKVEPKVRFPKDSYTPPKSRCPLRSGSQSPEPRLVYMSPADIVTTVLLNPSDEPNPEEELTPAALSILPPEFRSRQQAISLMNELQEDNYRLKLKCAEAATTIDRLRLEAKVNLYSDPPKPGLSLHSGIRTHSSRPMTLDFPCPKRAEFRPPSSPQTTGAQHHQHRSPVSSSSTSVRTLSDIMDTLCAQAQEFLQNVEAYEQNLQTTEGQTKQQLEVIQQMLQKLDTLERGYLVAKEKHKQLQSEGADIGNFDSQRELESLVFQCGLQMDELKEQVQQMDELKEQVQQKKLDSVSPPTHHTTHPPPLQTPPSPRNAPGVQQSRSSVSSTSSSVRGSSGVAEKLYQHQHKYPVASAFSGAQNITVVKSSAPEEDKLQTTSPDTLSKGDQPDHPKLFYTVKELPMPLVRDLSCHGRTSTADPQCGYEEAQRLCMANPQMPFTSASRKAEHRAQVHPAASSHLQNLPQHSPTSSTPFTTEVFDLHTQRCPPSRGFSVVVEQSPSSSLSSLREAPDRTDHKLPNERQRGTQDGLISPETDSGFMGSEGSRLTPAAAASPVHQRNPAGVVGVPVVDPSSGPSRSRQTKEGLVRPKPSRRSRRGEKRRPSSASCSQLHRDSRAHRTAERESCLSGHYSGSTSEKDQSDYSSCSSLSSCDPASRRHGDPLKFSNTGTLKRHDDAFQELQAEVLRLRDNMDWFVKDRSLPSTSTPIRRSDRHKTGQKRRTNRDEDETSQRSQTDQKRALSSKVFQSDDYFPQQVSRFTQTSADPSADPSARPENIHRSILSAADPSTRPESVHRLIQTSADPSARRESVHRPILSSADSCAHQETVYRPIQTSGDPSARPESVHRLIQTSADPSTHPESVHRPILSSTDPSAHPESVHRRIQLSSDTYEHPKIVQRPQRQSSERTEAADSLVCPECLWRRGSRNGNLKGHCRHCRLCGAAETDSFCHSDRAVPCVSVCPHTMLLYAHSSPIALSPTRHADQAKLRGEDQAKLRGEDQARLRKEDQTRLRNKDQARPRGLREDKFVPYVPTDSLSSLDEPLNRALRAARSMKYTSRHMVQTLSSGLQYQRSLAHTH